MITTYTVALSVTTFTCSLAVSNPRWKASHCGLSFPHVPIYHATPQLTSGKTVWSRATGGAVSRPAMRGGCRTTARRAHRARCVTMSAAFSSGKRDSSIASALAPPEIAEEADAPSDLLSAIESPRFTERYGAGAAKVAESVHANSTTSDFRWDHHWYAAHAVDHLDPDVPHAVTVLGRPMVLWRDSSETWRCFLDECPHRRVPLSEGRIDEKGRLACSYHAWSFNPDGKCACIPQASEGPEARAVDNARSRCLTFPVKVECGLLYVWPDENSPELAASTPPVLPSGHDDPDLGFQVHVRDLPYSYEYVAENFMDPAHVPVAHHNVGPFKRTQAQPLGLHVKRFDQSGFEGFADTEQSAAFRGQMDISYYFPTPGLWVFDRRIEREGKKFHSTTNTFMMPTTPGNCRVISWDGMNKSFLNSPLFSLLRLLGMKHFFLMDLLDSDAVFLHYQEVGMRAKEKRGGPSWRDSYFLPTRSDLYVITFGKWLERFAHGGVKYGPGWDLKRAPGGTREQLMDRYNGHVAHCKYCTDALAKYRKARVVFASVGAACLLILGGLLGSTLAAGQATAASKVVGPVALSLVLLSALCGLACIFCNFMVKKFVYTGWSHGRLA